MDSGRGRSALITGAICAGTSQIAVGPSERSRWPDRPWFLGANVPGKKPTTLCYLGGTGGYVAELDKEIGNGFAGFAMIPAPPKARTEKVTARRPSAGARLP